MTACRWITALLTVSATTVAWADGPMAGDPGASQKGGDPQAFEFVVTPYGWGPSVKGTLGVDGHEANLKLPIDDSLKMLTAAGMLGLEARKGRWGLLFDGTYMQLEDGVTTPGPFFSLVDVTYKQATLDLGAFYRIWEGDRGWVDVLAGGRYMYYSLDLGFTPDYAAAAGLSASIVDRTASAVRGGIEQAAESKADEIGNELSSRVTDTVDQLADAARQRVLERVGAGVDADALRSILRDAGDQLAAGLDGKGTGDKGQGLATRVQDAFSTRIDSQLHSGAERIASGAEAGRLAEAIRDAVADGVRQRIHDAGSGIEGNPGAIRDAVKQAIRDAAQDAIRDLKAKASAKVSDALDRAEQALTKKLTDGMEAAANANVSEETDWVDLYVGMRARWMLTRQLYAGLRGDVGGFGIGKSSDLVWELFGGVGYEFNRRVAMEAGWRHLEMQRSNETLDMDLQYSGATVGVSIRL